MSAGDIEFFPLLQALCLENEKDKTFVKLEALHAMVTSVLNKFKEEVFFKECIIESTLKYKPSVQHYYACVMHST